MKRIIQTLLVFVLAIQYSMAQAPKWIDKAKKALFSVVTYGKDGQVLHSGNGFFVSESGIAMSDYMLFKDADKAEIITSDGKKMPIEFILGVNEMYDVIKFKVGITEKKVPALTIAPTSPAVDATVYLLPYSTQKDRTFKTGTVKEVTKIGGDYHYYTLNMALTAKEVSCPVTNTDGQVIGLAQLGAGDDADKVCYAVGADFVMAQQLKALSLNSSALKNIGIKVGLPENEDEALVFLYVASSQLSSDDYLALLDEFIRQYPKNVDGYLRRASALSFDAKETAGYDKALDDFNKALSIADNKSEVYYALAKQMYQHRLSDKTEYYAPWTLDEALNVIDKAIAINPQPVYLQLAGDIRFAQRDYSGAYDWYNKVNESNIVSAATFFNAAKAKELANGTPDEVIALLDSCIARCTQPITADEAPYLLERAAQYMEAEKYRQAVVDYDSYFKAVNGHVNDVFYYYRVQAALKARQYQRAIDDIAKAIEINPTEISYKIEQAAINLRIGRYEQAVTLLQEIIKNNPDYAESYRLLGLCQVQQKQLKEACVNFNKAKALGDENVDELITKYCK